MKIVLSTVIVLLTLSGVAHAQGELSGSVKVGAVVYGGRPSQLDVDKDARKISSLEKKRDRANGVGPDLELNLGYGLDTGTHFGLEANLGGVRLSAAQILDGLGTMVLTGGLALGEEWKDPYVVGRKRSSTWSRDLGAGVAWTGILGSGAFVGYDATFHALGDDRTPDRDDKLGRKGVVHAVTAGYEFVFGDNHALTAVMIGQNGVMKGKADSFNALGGGLSYRLPLGRQVSWESSVHAFRRIFDTDHPDFGKTRKETVFCAETGLTWDAPLGWDDFALHFNVGFEKTQANIDFFDSSGAMVMTGVSYSF